MVWQKEPKALDLLSGDMGGNILVLIYSRSMAFQINVFRMLWRNEMIVRKRVNVLQLPIKVGLSMFELSGAL